MRQHRFLLLLSLLILISSPQLSSAQSTIGSSRILFVSTRESRLPQLYFMNPDGSNVTLVHHFPDGIAHPVWSPDGKKIAFQTAQSSSKQIYVAALDNFSGQNITNNPKFDDSNPSWSPDSQQLVFDSLSGDQSQIYVMNADSGRRTALLNDPPLENANDLQPSWSPDGKTIVYINAVLGAVSGTVAVMNADGSARRVIVNERAANPVWSPNGKKIAYIRKAGTGRSDAIVIVNPDGSKPVVIQGDEEIGSISWSPDSQQIVFNSDPLDSQQGSIIYVIGANGKNFKRLTDNTAANLTPAWSPVLTSETLQIFDQLAQNQLPTSASAPPADVQLLKIVVAQEVLPMGSRIEADDVMLCDWPINWISTHALTETSFVVGRIMRTTVPAGIPVVDTSAVDEGYAQNMGLAINPSPQGAKVACPQDFTEGVQVVVVAHDMPNGIVIPDVGLRMAIYPKEVVPKNAFTDIGQVLGKKACMDLYRENPILKNQIGACKQ
jgi:Flp pilus assembly protein CpaB